MGSARVSMTKANWAKEWNRALEETQRKHGSSAGQRSRRAVHAMSTACRVSCCQPRNRKGGNERLGKAGNSGQVWISPEQKNYHIGNTSHPDLQKVKSKERRISDVLFQHFHSLKAESPALGPQQSFPSPLKAPIVTAQTPSNQGKEEKEKSLSLLTHHHFRANMELSLLLKTSS